MPSVRFALGGHPGAATAALPGGTALEVARGAAS